MANLAGVASTSKSKKVTVVASSSGDGNYNVTEMPDGSWTCECKAFTTRKKECKHITSVKSGKKGPVRASEFSFPVEPSQPKPTGAGLSGLFSGKVAAPTLGAKKAKGKSKPIEEIPAELVPHTEVMVAGKMVTKRIENKIKAATDAVKFWCMQRFADVFAATGSRPATSTVIGGKAKFDFIQTKRIYLTPDRVQAVRDMGVDIDRWTDIKGVNINYEAIKRHGLEASLETALSSMGVTQAILEEIFQPKHELKEGFFDGLYSVCQTGLKKGEKLNEKIFSVLLALQPVSQTKNPDVELKGNSEDERLVAALQLILDSPVSAVGDSDDVEERDDE